MGEFFVTRIIDTGRLPLFCFFVAFIVTFLFTRINVRLIRANVRWWFKNVQAGDVHLHHIVFGVILMLLGGVAGLVVPVWSLEGRAASATVFGMGAALVLDEFALVLHLRDVYWTEEGRASVDAVFVAVAVTGILLLGLRPAGLSDANTVRQGVGHPDLFIGALAGLSIGLLLAIVTLLKGKIWTGLAGLFVVPLLLIGAIRLARPGSPWARWRYRPESKKMRKALRREERWRRPIVRLKIRVQEFIAGRHDVRLPDSRRRSNRSL